ncbi:MAG: hypothetical protein IH969_01190, partial [Candidatus Krumholzibacteriota bacterium]|nr:hypothetical protein [Candidatus Krumholzibacteriota bacterium]
MKTTFTRSIASVSVLLCAMLSVMLSAGALRASGPSPQLRTSEDQRITRPPMRVRINQYQEDRVRTYLSGAAPARLDTLRVIAFQVQFADSLMGGQPGSHRPELRDSTWFANELAHLRDYYRGASRGRMELDWELDGTLYTLPKGMGFYGDDRFEEIRVVELAQTLIASADASIDFSRYDHVFIIHAGA